MTQSKIKWKHGDYVRLGQAIAQFNKKINALQAEERKLYLPDIIDYTEKKETIVTRNELNRFIKSLKRFSLEGAEELYKTEAGEEITKWEHKELLTQARIAKNRLQAELTKLEEPMENGYSRVQMGSQQAKQIKRQIENLSELENKKGYEFKRLKERIKNIGTTDYTMRKAIIYRENYLKEMEKYSHFENYDKLMLRMKAITNPIKFFEFVSVNEITQDLTYQSDEYFTQQAFNSFLQDLGIEIDEDSVTLSDYQMRNRRAFINSGSDPDFEGLSE